jgi:hypothetical protein
MDPKLVSAEDHEIEYLARKHGMSKDEIKQIIEKAGSRSRKEVEAAIARHKQSA